MSRYSDQIEKLYEMAKRFRGSSSGGIAQVGEIPNPKKKVVRDEKK